MIRDRLTAIYTAIFLFAFVAYTAVVYAVPRTLLLREIDSSLEDTAELVLAGTQVYQNRDLYSLIIPTQEADTFRRANTFIMVVTPEGEILARSDNLRDFTQPLDPGAVTEGLEGLQTISYGEQVIRVLTAAVQVEEEDRSQLVGYLQVAQVMEEFETFNQLVIAAAFLGLAAATASAFVATLISPRLFRPLEEIARLAGQISRADDLSRRLPDTGRDDEIGQLTLALNQTLARLEELFTAQQRFLADVSHELRTPLTTIRGNVDLMRRMGGADDVSLDDIEAELERMTRLVNDLLLLARADVGSLPVTTETVEMDTLLLDVYRQVKALRPKVEVTLEEVDQVQVTGDSDRLKQLILNLVDNAVKYTPAGGQVFLSLHKDEGYAELTVRDTGIGIPEEDLPFIFDRFYRVDKARARAHGGSGLGLSIARWIVDVHKGTLTVDSKVGEGTTFTVRLPLRSPSSEPPEAPPAQHNQPSLAPGRR
ncbi:MAG: HAMP domain-containing protein [Chloroflexi bacterium]|nr:HAMP domain-containing protein [Chloroflexota bacterium]